MINVSGILKKVLLVGLVGFLAWAYQATRPPPPKICGSPDGPPVTAPRIQLKDGRYLAYKEFGVPKEIAKHKIVFVHGFDNCRHCSSITSNLSQVLVLTIMLLDVFLFVHACLSYSSLLTDLFFKFMNSITGYSGK